MSRIHPVFVPILLTLFPVYGYASSCGSQGEFALWTESDFKIVGADLAYDYCPNEFGSFRVGLSYFADSKSIYEGLTGAVRLQYGERLTPFVGLGALVGSVSRTMDASTDGVDNNQNGVIDEWGEQVTQSQVSGYLYPEVGMHWYAEDFGLTLSARRYYGTRFSGNYIYSLGLIIPLY